MKNMKTKFKNKDLVLRLIVYIWDTVSISYVIKRYEDGMPIEEIMRQDFRFTYEYSLRNFSHRYHLYITLYNAQKRIEGNHEKVH